MVPFGEPHLSKGVKGTLNMCNTGALGYSVHTALVAIFCNKLPLLLATKASACASKRIWKKIKGTSFSSCNNKLARLFLEVRGLFLEKQKTDLVFSL